MKSIFPFIVKTTIFFLAAIIAAVCFLKSGPGLETRFFPVIDDVRTKWSVVDKEGQIILVEADGNKVRQCEWKGITALVLRNGVWAQGSVYFKDPRPDGAGTEALKRVLPPSRPPGPQSLGVIYITPSGEAVRVYLYHHCHPLWQTTTFLYELPLK